MCLTFLSPLGIACECADPGVAGVVDIDTGVDRAQYAYLLVRMVVDPGEGALDVLALPPAGPAYRNTLVVPLSSAELPYAFQIGGQGIGGSEEQHHLAVAWLSVTAGDRPQPGDPWGATPFSLGHCKGGWYDGLVRGVNITIEPR